MGNSRSVRHTYSRKRAIFDLDSIIANLMDPWLEWYNQEFNDNLRFQDIKTYHIEEHVKPECGNRIFEFFRDPSRYGRIPVFEGATEGLQKLHDNGVDVVIATAMAGSTAPEKYTIAKRAAPWIDKHHIIIGTRKELLHGHFFTDDAPKNMEAYLSEWPDAHVLTIGHPYNQDFRSRVSLFADDCFNPKKAWGEITDYILNTDIQ